MKSKAISSAQRRRARPAPGQLPNAVEGQLEEICRDLAIQAKRMRQLQEQADELRTVIREWAAQFEGVEPQTG